MCPFLYHQHFINLYYSLSGNFIDSLYRVNAKSEYSRRPVLELQEVPVTDSGTVALSTNSILHHVV